MDPIGKPEVRASMEAARRQLPPSASHPPGRANSLPAGFARFITEGTRRHPAAWLGGAALVGFALSELVVGRQPPPKSRAAASSRGRPLFKSAVRNGMNALKPLLAEWGRRKASDFLQNASNAARARAAASPAQPESPL